MSQKQYKPHYLQLKKKWLDRHKDIQKSLWEKHQESLHWLHRTSKHAMVGSMAGILMMAHPVTGAVIAQNLPSPDKQLEQRVVQKLDKKNQLMKELATILPKEVQPLTAEQETRLSQKLTEIFSMPVSAELQGKRLNRSYGLIGAEQHLMRYPGDSMATHFATPEEQTFAASGMAPGRGAWGYFAPSKEAMTEKEVQREKYYIAVQTFLAPGFNENVNVYYNFFRYRKMLVINPENGKAMVTVIGDAGPAAFTGKHLGGSPEVMRYLERVDGAAKGPVLYFFIDDPTDTIPLGPIPL